MVKKLILVWVLGVVAFFALWALFAFIFRRISERKQNNNDEQNSPDNP